MSQLEREWGPLLKTAATWTEVALNESFWQWEYNASYRHATVLINGVQLRLVIDDEHVKTGLGAGRTRKILEDVSLGTLQKPNVTLAISLLKKHGHNRTRAGGPFSKQWGSLLTDFPGKHPLGEILLYLARKRSSVDPKKVDGQRAAIMDKLDKLNPEQVEAIFNSVMKM